MNIYELKFEGLLDERNLRIINSFEEHVFKESIDSASKYLDRMHIYWRRVIQWIDSAGLNEYPIGDNDLKVLLMVSAAGFHKFLDNCDDPDIVIRWQGYADHLRDGILQQRPLKQLYAEFVERLQVKGKTQ
jgi:hypothetical protein